MSLIIIIRFLSAMYILQMYRLTSYFACLDVEYATIEYPPGEIDLLTTTFW